MMKDDDDDNDDDDDEGNFPENRAPEEKGR